MKYILIICLVFANSMEQNWKDFQWGSNKQDVQRPYKTSVSKIDDLQSLDSYKNTSTLLGSNSQQQDTELQEPNQSNSQEVNKISENTNEILQNSRKGQKSVLYPAPTKKASLPQSFFELNKSPKPEIDDMYVESEENDNSKYVSSEEYSESEEWPDSDELNSYVDDDYKYPYVAEPKYEIYNYPIKPYTPEQTEHEVKVSSNKIRFSKVRGKSRQNRGVVYRPLFQYRQEQARKQRLQANRATPAPHYQPQHYPVQHRRNIRGVVYRPLFQYKEEEARKERLRAGKSHQEANTQQATQQPYSE